jgi:hypothetical protein
MEVEAAIELFSDIDDMEVRLAIQLRVSMASYYAHNN